jgi:8-oxo-dGTP pyrophosphatase MutT (NUDIX family)
MRAVDASANAPFVLTTAENPASDSSATDTSASDTSASDQPVIRDAATVLLVADRPDLHVLMLERTRRAVFGPGATVFPGGAVDAADRETRSSQRVVGLDDRVASAEHGFTEGGLAFRIAALRECFEEAGLLLAHDRQSGRPVEHDAHLAAARDLVNAGELSFAELLEARQLVLDARELRLFSHWLTPIGAPRRYNTWFFIAPAPEGEDGAHDDNELVASGWVRPADALVQHGEGQIDLVFPTEMSLRTLARYQHSRDLFDDLDAAPRDSIGGLRVLAEGTGERIALRADAGRPTSHWTIPLPEISYRTEREAAQGMGK